MQLGVLILGLEVIYLNYNLEITNSKTGGILCLQGLGRIILEE